MTGKQPKERIGYIGLGDMGAAMALHLADQDWPLTIYARRAVTLEPFRNTSAKIAGSPREVGAHSDLLCICVVDTRQIEDVLFGPNGAVEGLSEDAVVVIHSTISPEDCRALAARLATVRIHLVDAPVSGAAERGRAGELVIAIGGEPAVVARCMPLFETEGTLVAHLGAVGSGQIAKLLNNGLFIIQVSLVDEIIALGARMGLDGDMVLKLIGNGTAASWASGYYARALERDGAIFAHDTTYPGGVVEIVRKDMGLFLKQLQHAGLGDARMAEIGKGAVNSIRRLKPTQ